MAATALGISACGGGISETATQSSTGSTPSTKIQAAADGVVLSYTTQHTESTPLSRAIQKYGEQVAEATEGRVTFENYYSAQLLPAAEVVNGIGDGRADTGYVVDVMFADQLPLTNSSSIPFDRTNGVAQAQAYQKMYEENEAFKAEYEKLGLHVLSFLPMGETILGSTFKVDTLEDLKGHSVRCLGFICEAYEKIGGHPAAIASNEIYEAMDRKTIDGWAGYPFMDVPATQLQEVSPNMTLIGLGQYSQGVFPISESVWEKISPEDQKVMTELASKLPEMIAEENLKAEGEACEVTTEANVTLSSMADEEVNKWKEVVYGPIYDKWVEAASQKSGTDADAFYKDLMSAYEEILKETNFKSSFVECSEKSQR
ncbi:TRAP transporter substrate-binding protein DctP [Actinomyces sp. B33]|nr:TRAP transporter substrate-binding protein DctP [Actinomyces sp. B33]